MRVKIDSPSFFIGKGDLELISFGSGQPDLPPPQEVFDILPNYGDFKYGLIQGQRNLCKALTQNYPGATSEQFVITNGASEALDLSLRILSQISENKKILLPKPYYYSYPYNVRFAGMEPVYYNLVEGKIDTNTFFDQAEKCAAVLINSPSNPTGSVQDIDVLKKIEAFTKERDIYIISDEVYKDLIYDRENYLLQGPHVLTINSFSKTYAMCGFRVGYLYSTDKGFVQKVIEMKTHTSMNTNILGQEMAYAATQVPKHIINKQVDIWKKRRDIIVSGLKDLGLNLSIPEGAFYVLPEIPDSNKAVNELFYDHKMITYDGSWFGAPGHIRFSYALEKEKIAEGLERLKRYLKNRSK